MSVIVYGDFNCPYSYLASQRADRLLAAGVEVDWRAVEHNPAIPPDGLPAEQDRAAWDREIADVAAHARADEQPPDAPPPLISNTAAAIAAYAAVTTATERHALRRRLFQAIWVEGRHLGAAEVNRLVEETGVARAAPPEAERRAGQWQARWSALPRPIVPTVVGADDVVHRGLGGLAYLAESATSHAAR